MKTSIDWTMVKPPDSLQAFKQALKKEKINLVIRQNENGIVYGLTYIDHNTKCVFNGSEIGKEYSAKSILEKCRISQLLTVQENSKIEELNQTQKTSPDLYKPDEQKEDLSKLIDVIITPTEQYNYLPYELRKQKRKKKKSQ